VKFLADENVDKSVVEYLRKYGRHEVLYVTELEASISDDEVTRRANEESALLLTADKDFGELVFRQKRVTHGVVLIRLSGLSGAIKAAAVAAAIDDHANELAGNFTVITPWGVRVRRRRA
jgi:predicted nuclease of predicted toxin-antitoxin system